MIVFDHEFDPTDSTQDTVCFLCRKKLKDADSWCPFGKTAYSEFEEETLP